ncbi:uncharacterized protein LOC18434245 [Amborella trichopoda]|nr:uncharacterized protein LOC18434245 [Amborella trichopoda]|eukprot:XP_006844382.2 uncharacterized protein LOC18434245 [Amborella trichopoda]
MICYSPLRASVCPRAHFSWFSRPSYSQNWSLIEKTCRSCRINCCTVMKLPEKSLKVIKIPYSVLLEKDRDLSEKIEAGFGPNGLGIISISDVPEFSLLRQNLLPLSSRLANLPDEIKIELEDPGSSYNFGWSHGKEKLESGKADMLKGSFYANPINDTPTNDASLMHRYPAYCRPNLWPRNHLPELELAFKALGKLMLDIGLMLSYHCDNYVSNGNIMYDYESLQQILRQSQCHKGRLLYYFPRQKSEGIEHIEGVSSWCGWHTDHGSLTGLTCGMFMKDGVEVACPDTNAGLYIKTRANQIVKAVFGEDEIAYQIGETTELLSSGLLCATPHCVQAPRGEKACGLQRATFALFMQPDWDENLKFPSEINLHKEIIQPNSTLTFGEYTEKLINKYYH